MPTQPTVYLIEVLVQGVWKPTSNVVLVKRSADKLAVAMIAEDESKVPSYRAAAYVRKTV